MTSAEELCGLTDSVVGNKKGIQDGQLGYWLAGVR